MVQLSEKLLTQVIKIAKQAGEAILEVYSSSEPLDVCKKSDNTPVTQADLEAHEIITTQLTELTPDWQLLSEESANIEYATRKQWQTYWLIDPLDGTKEFIKHNDEFTVNIALIENGKSILGVVYAPVFDTCYFAMQGFGAFKQSINESAKPIQSQKLCAVPYRVAASRSHGKKQLQKFLMDIGDHEIISMGSSLKSCLVAEGKADLYPRLGPTSEWDTAAAQCIVEEAGGVIVAVNGEKLSYNGKESLLNPWFFVSGDPSFDWIKYLNEPS